MKDPITELREAAAGVIEWEDGYRKLNILGKYPPHAFARLATALAALPSASLSERPAQRNCMRERPEAETLVHRAGDGFAGSQSDQLAALIERPTELRIGAGRGNQEDKNKMTQIRAVDLSKFEYPVSDYDGLQELLDVTRMKLFDPTYRRNVAIHEGAHAYYFLKSGSKRVQYRATAPHLFSNGKIKIGAAGVNYEEGAIWLGTGSDVARACVAGLCATKFFTGYDGGAGADKLALKQSYLDSEYGSAFSSDMLDALVDYIWNDASMEVNADLKDRRVQDRILQIADHFEGWLLCEHEEDGYSANPINNTQKTIAFIDGENEGHVYAEFCHACGAGIGKFRRDGEGTCPECDETIPAHKI